MFCNRYYGLKLALPLFVVGGLCLYSLFAGPRQHLYYGDCLADASTCDGKTVAAPGGRIIAVKPDGFLLRHRGFEFFVSGPTGGVAAGQYADILCVFRKNGTVELKAIHTHDARYRNIKLGVSLIPLAVLAVMFGRLRLKTAL